MQPVALSDLHNGTNTVSFKPTQLFRPVSDDRERRPRAGPGLTHRPPPRDDLAPVRRWGEVVPAVSLHARFVRGPEGEQFRGYSTFAARGTINPRANRSPDVPSPLRPHARFSEPSSRSGLMALLAACSPPPAPCAAPSGRPPPACLRRRRARRACRPPGRPCRAAAAARWAAAPAPVADLVRQGGGTGSGSGLAGRLHGRRCMGGGMGADQCQLMQIALLRHVPDQCRWRP